MPFWGSTPGSGGGTGLTTEQVQQMIIDTINDLPPGEVGLSADDVRSMIETALADLPPSGTGEGITEAEVQNLIDAALAGLPAGGDGGGLSTEQIKTLISETLYGKDEDNNTLPVLDLDTVVGYLEMFSGTIVEELPEGAVATTLERISPDTDPTYIRAVAPVGALDLENGRAYSTLYAVTRGDGLPASATLRLGYASSGAAMIAVTSTTSSASYEVSGGDEQGVFDPPYIPINTPSGVGVTIIPNFEDPQAVTQEHDAGLYIQLDPSNPVKIPGSPPVLASRTVLTHNQYQGASWETQNLYEGVLQYRAGWQSPRFGRLVIGDAEWDFTTPQPGYVLTAKDGWSGPLYGWAPASGGGEGSGAPVELANHMFYLDYKGRSKTDGTSVTSRVTGLDDTIIDWGDEHIYLVTTNSIISGLLTRVEVTIDNVIPDSVQDGIDFSVRVSQRNSSGGGAWDRFEDGTYPYNGDVLNFNIPVRGAGGNAKTITETLWINFPFLLSEYTSLWFEVYPDPFHPFTSIKFHGSLTGRSPAV